MRWLQWSTYNLTAGIGGVEVHARELADRLGKQGIEAKLSSHPEDLSATWDVIHTHGSSILPRHAYGKTNTTYVHTLHGTTFGRMWACREFFWVGGYLAQLRELWAVLRSHLVLAVHPDLWLFRLARWLGKRTAVCGNGWDAGSKDSVAPLPLAIQALLSDPQPFWVFIGRGSDPVKGASRLQIALESLPPSFRLLAAPGEGFINIDHCYPTGPLQPGQIRKLLQTAQGLVLCSYYEGLPLVVLEALAQGTRVASTEVGGLKILFQQARAGRLAGLYNLASARPAQITQVLQSAETEPLDRKSAAQKNQAALQTWDQVAQACHIAVTRIVRSDPPSS